MTWVALGAAAVGVVGSAIVANNNKPGTPSATADGPFFGGGQAQQYQGQLAMMVNTGGDTQGGATTYNNPIANLSTTMANIGTTNAQNVANGQGTNIAQDQMINLMTGGPQSAQALSQTPGYQFDMSQGVAAIQASSAANGMLGSTGEGANLMQFGQGLAQNTMNSQMTNLGNLSNSLSSSQQAGISTMGAAASQYSGLNAAAANNYSNQFSQLAQLSGANMGNPGVAGQLQQTANANSAAFVQSLATPAVNAMLNTGTTNTAPGQLNPTTGQTNPSPDTAPVSDPVDDGSLGSGA